MLRYSYDYIDVSMLRYSYDYMDTSVLRYSYDYIYVSITCSVTKKYIPMYINTCSKIIYYLV